MCRALGFYSVRIGTRDKGETLIRKNDPFSELSAGRAFRSKTGLLAVRITRFEKQSSIIRGFEADE